MVIDLREYKFVGPIVKAVLSRDHGNRSLNYIITSTAVDLPSPIIVVAYYFAKEMGMCPEIKQVIETMMDFYKYTEVLGIETI